MATWTLPSCKGPPHFPSDDTAYGIWETSPRRCFWITQSSVISLAAFPSVDWDSGGQGAQHRAPGAGAG